MRQRKSEPGCLQMETCIASWRRLHFKQGQKVAGLVAKEEGATMDMTGEEWLGVKLKLIAATSRTRGDALLTTNATSPRLMHWFWRTNRSLYPFLPMYPSPLPGLGKILAIIRLK